jgi:hypothetical protein
MSSTKNTKDNRQVVKATFYPPESVFEIPDGIDLEDETIVKWWEVKYNMLCICYVNGKLIQISPVWDGMDGDIKHPMDCEIISANDAGYEYDEDEDDEKIMEKIDL